jgi:RimJ/RimL family protein N-acetyltransferase
MISPGIDTARLTLRTHRAEDFADCVQMWADPAVCRFIGGRPFTEEEVWAKVLRYAGLWSLLGYGYWVVREKSSGRFVGEVGLADFRRDVTPSFQGAPESGWALSPWAWGKGFATEALGATLHWLEREKATPRTVCMIDPTHVASARVAEKCGYRLWQIARYKGSDCHLFERLAKP